AVPPVETSSTPNAASLRAKSTSPDLSVTLRMARWILDMRKASEQDEPTILAKRDSSSCQPYAVAAVYPLKQSPVDTIAIVRWQVLWPSAAAGWRRGFFPGLRGGCRGRDRKS